MTVRISENNASFTVDLASIVHRGLRLHKELVKADSGGSDAWHTLTDSFKSGDGTSGWDAIVFRDEKDTWRKGVYMHIKDITVYITIHGPTTFASKFELNSGGPNTRNRLPSSQPYIGDCVLIRNASSKRFQAFVSSHNGGSNSWFTLTKSFKDGRWNRSGWEVIVCRNAEDTWRKGVYVHIKDVTVYVTERVSESETLYNDYQPSLRSSGRMISKDSTGRKPQIIRTECKILDIGFVYSKGDHESREQKTE
ncbi:hypothetical protein IMY05_C4684000100 [Salix suchowensis]|nr:hypothetical protein IMY05_C4684000100 [Salix suchowensis]